MSKPEYIVRNATGRGIIYSCKELEFMSIAELSALNVDVNSTLLTSMDELRHETDKIGSIHAPTVDWARVAMLAERVLTENGNHFKVLAYWAVSMLHQQGFKSIDTAVVKFTHVIEYDWQDAMPPVNRIRARSLAIDWWLDKTLQWLKRLSSEQLAQQSSISQLSESLSTLQQQLAAKELDCINAETLINLLAEVETPETKLGPNTILTVENSMPEQQEAVASESEVETVPIELEQQIKTCCSQQLSLANHLFEKDYKDSRSYRLRRIALWMPIEGLPTHDNQLTALISPETNDKSQLQLLVDSKNWLGLLNFCEQKLSSYRFWLDLNDYAALALKQLGFQNLADLVCDELKYLLSRLHGLQELTFADGYPFLSNNTADLISSSPFEADNVNLNKPTVAIPTEAFAGMSFASDTVLNSLLSQENCDHIYKLAVKLIRNGHLTAAKVCVERLIYAIEHYQLQYWQPDRAARYWLCAFEFYQTVDDEQSKHNAFKHLLLVKPQAAELLNGL